MKFIKNGYSIHFLRHDLYSDEYIFGLFYEDRCILEDDNEGFLKKRKYELEKQEKKRGK